MMRSRDHLGGVAGKLQAGVIASRTRAADLDQAITATLARRAATIPRLCDSLLYSRSAVEQSLHRLEAAGVAYRAIPAVSRQPALWALVDPTP